MIRLRARGLARSRPAPWANGTGHEDHHLRRGAGGRPDRAPSRARRRRQPGDDGRFQSRPRAPDHRSLRRRRRGRLRLASGRAGAGRGPGRRHGDRRDPVRRGQHGGLPGRAFDLLGAAQDRPPAQPGLPHGDLLRPLPHRRAADRRGDLAGIRGRRRGDAAPDRPGRVRHRRLSRRRRAADRHHARRGLRGAEHAAASALGAVLDAQGRRGRRAPRRAAVRAGTRGPALRRRPDLRDRRHHRRDARHGGVRQDAPAGQPGLDRRRRQHRPQRRAEARGGRAQGAAEDHRARPGARRDRRRRAQAHRRAARRRPRTSSCSRRPTSRTWTRCWR